MKNIVISLLLLGLVGCKGPDSDGKPYEATKEEEIQYIDGTDRIPPIPNYFSNHETLAGVDSDGDGVRDDVEVWINEKGENRPIRQCLKIIAMNLTNGIINYRDKELAYKFNTKINDAKGCLYKIYGKNYRNIRPLTTSLYTQIINSNERSKAYILMDRSLGGEAFPINTINPCETVGVEYE